MLTGLTNFFPFPSKEGRGGGIPARTLSLFLPTTANESLRKWGSGKWLETEREVGGLRLDTDKNCNNLSLWRGELVGRGRAGFRSEFWGRRGRRPANRRNYYSKVKDPPPILLSSFPSRRILMAVWGCGINCWGSVLGTTKWSHYSLSHWLESPVTRKCTALVSNVS